MKRYVIVGCNFSSDIFIYYLLDKFDKSDGARYFLKIYDNRLANNTGVIFGLETNDEQLALNKVKNLNKISNLLK